MPDAVSIGPLAIPPNLAIMVFSILTTAVVARVLKFRHPERATSTALLLDIATGALLFAFLAWKLTPLLTWWEVIIAEPIRLLRIPGGRAGTMVGIIVGGLYALLRLRREENLNLGDLLRSAVPLAVVLALSATVATTVLHLTHTPGIAGTADASLQSRPLLPPDLLQSSAGTLDGDEEQLISTTQTTVVTFWATWCGPCHAELPIKARFYEEHGDRVSFVSVNLTSTEGSVETVRGYVEENEITWPVFLDTNSAISRRFGVRGTPTTIVISPDGTLQARWMGPSSLDRLVRATSE